MFRSARIGFAVTGVLLSLALFSTVSVAGSPSLRVGFGNSSAAEDPSAAAQLTLLRADYRVEMFGPLAEVRLVQEFRNDSAETVLAAYTASGARSRVVRLEAGPQGDLKDVRKPVTRKNKGRASNSRTKQPKDSHSAVRSVPLSVDPGENVIVELGLQFTPRLQQGMFLLKLPEVSPLREPVAGEVPLGIYVNIHESRPDLHVESPSHNIFSDFDGEMTRVELAERETLEPGEFILEVGLASDEQAALTGFAGPKSTDGTRELTVVFTPPAKKEYQEDRPKQLLFLVDRSGSMGKGKLDRVVQGITTFLDALGENDRYNLFQFNGDHTSLSEGPVAVSENEAARRWLRDLRPGGSTRILSALKAVLQQPADGERHRMIVILTDGAIQDGQAATDLLEADPGQSRLFVVGIGEDVKRDTIRRIAEKGRGSALFAIDADEIESVMAHLFESVSAPLVWDLELDVGSAEVQRIRPERLPDLYAGRPVTLRAKIRGPLPSEVTLRGITTSGPREFRSAVSLASGSEADR